MFPRASKFMGRERAAAAPGKMNLNRAGRLRRRWGLAGWVVSYSGLGKVQGVVMWICVGSYVGGGLESVEWGYLLGDC